MIRHLFKLMWNQKRRNAGLLIEVFASFLVIFVVFSFLIHNLNRYREPLGFDYRNVLVLEFEPRRSYGAYLASDEDPRTPEQQTVDLIYQQLNNYPEFAAYALIGSMPYLNGYSSTLLLPKTKKLRTSFHYADEHFPEVMNMELKEGSWFTAPYTGAGPIPMIINEKLREQLFGEQEAIGQEIAGPGEKIFKVIGLLQDFKNGGEFSGQEPFFFCPVETMGYAPQAIAIKPRPGADPSVRARLFDDVKRITRNWTVRINYLDEFRRKVLLKTWIPTALFLTVSGFLIFNVALGLFGVIWQNINKRRPEIGVRRAVGATRGSIRSQVIIETMALASLSLVVGVFFAVQFPLLDVLHLQTEVYLTAIGLAVVFIYAVVLVCSVYPGVLAGRIQPAAALHEE